MYLNVSLMWSYFACRRALTFVIEKLEPLVSVKYDREVDIMPLRHLLDSIMENVKWAGSWEKIRSSFEWTGRFRFKGAFLVLV